VGVITLMLEDLCRGVAFLVHRGEAPHDDTPAPQALDAGAPEGDVDDDIDADAPE
jgi:hypothetical protein